jgi:hypothetical protein
MILTARNASSALPVSAAINTLGWVKFFENLSLAVGKND